MSLDGPAATLETVFLCRRPASILQKQLSSSPETDCNDVEQYKWLL